MKIITEPKVYLVGKETVDRDELRRFLTDIGTPEWKSTAEFDGDELPEIAGRLCYESFKSPRPGGNPAYLEHIKDSGHGSVLEAVVFGMIVTGIGRSCSHEIIRHRAGMSYSELSQRFVDCSDIAFVVPPAMMKYKLLWDEWGQGYIGPESELAAPFSKWLDQRAGDLSEYEEWTQIFLASAPPELTGTDRRKWARQASRNCLPNNAETKIFITGNGRSVRNFIEQRGSRHADAEIRRLANYILDAVRKRAPTLFFDYVTTPLPDGTFEITTKTPKV